MHVSSTTALHYPLLRWLGNVLARSDHALCHVAPTPATVHGSISMCFSVCHAAMRKRDATTLIFHSAVSETPGVADGLPVLAAIILGRDPELTDYCFCSFRQDTNKLLKSLVSGRDKPSDLAKVVDQLHRQCKNCGTPILARHSAATYKQLLGLVMKGDSPRVLQLITKELTDTLDSCSFDV